MSTSKRISNAGTLVLLFAALSVPAVSRKAAAESAALSINAQNYVSASGEVTKVPNAQTLVLYGKRSVTYNFTAASAGPYRLRLYTAQVSGKNTPSPDYKFLFNILVDGRQILSDAPLPAEKTYAYSEFLELGELAVGDHALTLQWTNDMVSETYDTNVGIDAIEISPA